MQLRFLKGRLSGRSVEVGPSGFVIGREAGSDLQLAEEGISRRHCRVFCEDGTWFVEDLGSTNGVRVNGVKVTGRFAIKPGDRVGLFNQTLLFSDGSDIVDVDAIAAKSDSAETTRAPGRPPSQKETPTVASKPIPPGLVPPLQPSPAKQEAPGQQQDGLPWGRVVLLLALVAVLAWFVKITLEDSTEKHQQQDTNRVIVEDEGPGDEQAAVVIEMPGDVTEVDVREEEPAPIVQVATFEDPGVQIVAQPDDDRPPAPRGPAATILVESLPPGADVMLAGVQRGKTPLMIRDVPVGRHELTLLKNGYETLTREVENPNNLPRQPYAMTLQAGAVRITSQPEGAAVLHGTQIVGATPLVLTDLPVGRQEFRLVKFGYEPVRKEVMVSAAEGVEENVTMESLLGGVSFVTVPAGCRIYVDNVLKGKTIRGDALRNKSKPLRVSGLKEGEHVARVEHPNGVSKSDIIRIRRGVTSTLFIELWVIDTKVVLNDGTEHYGMLFSKNEAGDVIINERGPGDNNSRPKQYLKEQIKEITEVGAAEGRTLMEKLGLSTGTGQEGKALAVPGADPGTDGVPGIPDADGGGEKALVYTADELTALIMESNTTALTKMLGGREIVLTGVPTEIKSTLARAEISFGKAITCELDRETYDRVGVEIRNAEEQGLNITIKGKTVARVQSVTLRQCTFFSETEQ